MRVTDQARRALVLAAGAAHGRGDKPVSGYHVLLALAEAEGGARHVLGSSSARLRDAPSASALPDAKSPAVALGTAKDIVDGAIARANLCGRDQATTADILFVALGPGDGPVASLLRGAGAEPATIRASLASGDHGACCQETGVSQARTVMAGMGAQADCIPGRGRAAAGIVGGLIPYALLYCVVLAIVWDTSGLETLLLLAATTTFSSVLLSPMVLRRRVRESVAKAAVILPVPQSMRPLLDRLGLRQLEVRTDPEAPPGRCYRRGRRAWIILGPATEQDPEQARFVLWHEVAHLARRDITAFRLSAQVGVGLIVGTVASLNLRAVAVAVVGTAMLTVAGRWWSEAACDRFAVRRAGPAALHAWATVVRGSVALLRRQKKLPTWARLKGLFTHPPLALRTALHPSVGHHDRDTEHGQATIV